MNPTRPTSCEHGDCAGRLDGTSVRVRRGEHVLAVPQKVWVCERCRDPDTGAAMRFIDPSLREINQALADAAWRDHFGEPLPPGQKPGRKPTEPLDERVVAMLSKAELARLDAARGDRSRSEFLRDAARRLVESVEHQKAG
jgi:hypothetical protein